MRKVFLLTIFALLFIFSAGVAEACSCMGYPSVCGSYQMADAVFIGSVQRVEQPPLVKDEDGEEYAAGQTAYIQVEKVFKGMKQQTEVIFRTEGSSCDAIYKEGQRWLFYAYYDKKSKRWSTHACDRNTRIEDAGDDLLYLQGLPASAQKTRIAGVLKHYENDPAEGFKRVKNISGVKIKITGDEQTYEVYTDKNGAYEIYGLPPGKYTIEPEPVAGLKASFPIFYGEVERSFDAPFKLVLREKSCAGANFIYSSETSISRTVFGDDGRALTISNASARPVAMPERRDSILLAVLRTGLASSLCRLFD